jgi:hypothetical protein
VESGLSNINAVLTVRGPRDFHRGSIVSMGGRGGGFKSFLKPFK